MQLRSSVEGEEKGKKRSARLKTENGIKGYDANEARIHEASRRIEYASGNSCRSQCLNTGARLGNDPSLARYTHANAFCRRHGHERATSLSVPLYRAIQKHLAEHRGRTTAVTLGVRGTGNVRRETGKNREQVFRGPVDIWSDSHVENRILKLLLGTGRKARTPRSFGVSRPCP